MKLKEIFENFLYQTSKYWLFTIDGKKPKQFGVIYEITNMAYAVGGSEYAEYPFIVSAQIIAHKCHKSFNDADNGFKPTLDNLRYDCLRYMGGVPIDHFLSLSTKDGNEEGDAFDVLVKQFPPLEAKVTVEHPQFGTVASQNGRGAEHKYLQFRTEEAAKRYCDLLSKRASVLSNMIGFILDKPINLMGEAGWDVMRKQVYGSKIGNNYEYFTID